MTKTPIISVVMPTYNRADAIGLTLQHLAQQTLPPDQFEVIVVDDGSHDNTDEIVTLQSWPFNLTFLQQSNKGAAAARNLGVSCAQADLIVFLDSDVIADSDLLELHLKSQADHENRILIGRMKPWRRISRPWYENAVDPESTGRDYGDEPREVPFFYAYTCNMSIKRSIFQCLEGFDESFPAAGFEDTDIAYRSHKLGYKIYYQPHCVGYHNHSLTLEQRMNKEAMYAASLALLVKKYPVIRTEMVGVDELMPLWSSPCPAKSLWRRSRSKFFALSPIRVGLLAGLLWLDARQMHPRLASILYWKLLTGWRCAGFHDGLRRYDNLISKSN